MRRMVSNVVACLMVIGAMPAAAQDSVRTIDPNQAIDADLSGPRTPVPARPASPYPDYTPPSAGSSSNSTTPLPPMSTDAQQQAAARDGAEAVAGSAQTFNRQELLAAAEGTLGKGTAGLAGMLEKILKDQGEPNAYIAGSEAGGAFVLGLRYGKGEMFHKIEGQQPVYWTGPSVGFDIGGDGSKVFALVYNLYDTEDLYRKRFASGEGRLFFIGGVAATYLRMGDKVVIPIRLGVGWRQGANIGYMKFSHSSKWFPF